MKAAATSYVGCLRLCGTGEKAATTDTVGFLFWPGNVNHLITDRYSNKEYYSEIYSET